MEWKKSANENFVCCLDRMTKEISYFSQNLIHLKPSYFN